MAELIVGHSNSKHVSGVDFALTLSSIVGAGTFQAPDNNGNYPQAVVQDANTIQIPAGYFFIDGRPIRVPAAEPVTIDNGQTGFKRIDLICAHYQADSDGIETVKFDVLKGRTTTGTPVEPSLSSPAWNVESTTNSRKPIARVTLDGLTPTVQITAEKLGTLHEIDSRLSTVKSTTVNLPYLDRSVAITRQGRVVVISEQVVSSGDTPQNSHTVSPYHEIPVGYRPVKQGIIMLTDYAGQSASFMINREGKVEINGNISNGRYLHLLGTWITTDEEPA